MSEGKKPMMSRKTLLPGMADHLSRVRCSLFVIGGLVFSLTCIPMDAVASPIIKGIADGLPGLTLGTVGTEAAVCTNDACDAFLNVPNNSYVGNVGGAGGATAATAAEFSANGIPAPALVDANAYINDLSLSVGTCCNVPPIADGSGEAFAAFTDVLTFSSTALTGAVTAFAQLNFDPSSSGSLATLSLFWYGPGTGCDSTDYISLCQASQGPAASFSTTIILPALTDADTLLVFMSLSGDACCGGSASDPSSIIISNLPAGVSIISEGGGTYTASVPEPASWMMIAASVVLLCMGRRRRSA